MVVKVPLSSRNPCSDSSGIDVAAHDLAAVVDVEGEGLQGARELDRREDAVGQQKMSDCSGLIDEAADDLAAVVEVEERGFRGGVRGIDRGEVALLAQQNTMDDPLGIAVDACDLATVVDAGELGFQRAPGHRWW